MPAASPITSSTATWSTTARWVTGSATTRPGCSSITSATIIRTPSPLLMMAHIAAKLPDLSLGTSVLVLPWYHPLRLAEEIAMLNSLTRGTLHLGIGRGTARMEYDAYNIDMNEARARFDELLPHCREGARRRAVHPCRPLLDHRQADPAAGPRPVRQAGALSTARSAARPAPPSWVTSASRRSVSPRSPTDSWRRSSSAGVPAPARRPTNAIPPDLGEAVHRRQPTRRRVALGRRYYPPYFALQADHYEADANPWADIRSIRTSAACSRTCARWPIRTSSGRSSDSNLVGSVEADLQAHRRARRVGVQLLHGVVRDAGHAARRAARDDGGALPTRSARATRARWRRSRVA